MIGINLSYRELKQLAILRLRNDKFSEDWLKVVVGRCHSWGFWYYVTMEDGTVFRKKFKLKGAKLYLSEFLFLRDKGVLEDLIKHLPA